MSPSTWSRDLVRFVTGNVSVSMDEVGHESRSFTVALVVDVLFRWIRGSVVAGDIWKKIWVWDDGLVISGWEQDGVGWWWFGR